MRYLIFVLALIPVCLFAQYPTTGVKQRLGYQTTADGLVYRGNGAPAYTPATINNAWMYLDTTANSLYAWIDGAWELVTAGGGGTFDGHVDSLVFNVDAVVVDSVGKMYYDSGNETISVGIDGGAVYQMGQELFYPLVINKSGALIHNGQLVMVDTATLTTGDHVRVILARNGAAYPSSYIMGVATTDIENDSTGLVTFFGYVREVKHDDIAQTGATLDVGDILYASATQPGRYTDTPPASPAHKSTIALVVRNPGGTGNNMTLLVRPWLAPKLATLSDVTTTSVTGLSVLRYNSTTGNWEASATAGIVAADTAAMLSTYLRKADTTAMLAPYQKDITLTTTGTSGAASFNGVTLNVPQYQAALTNPVTGTGISGRVAYWSGTNAITGSSGLTWDNANTRLGINDATTVENELAYFVIRKDQNALTSMQVTNKTSGTSASATVRLTSSVGSTVLREAGELNSIFKNRFTIEPNATAPGHHFAISLPSNNGNFEIYTGGRDSTFQKMKLLANGNMILNSGYLPDQSVKLFIGGTDGIRIPVGTSAQRVTGAAGVLRFNTTTSALEVHTGTRWDTVATSTSTAQVHYQNINVFDINASVANTTTSPNFFLVPANLNGYCIDSYTVRAISGSGTADIQLGKNGSGTALQSISGTTTYTKDTNITLATGDYIQGQVFNLSAGATLAGLGITIEIKSSCN